MTHTLPIQVIHQKVGGGDPVDITPWVDSLEFRSTSPGGYATASFTLNIPLVDLPITYTQYSWIDIVNTASSTVLWEGLGEDPGRFSGPDGQTFRFTAVGASSTFKDIKRPYVAIDSSLESWTRGAPPYMQETTALAVDSEVSVGGPAILMSVPSGTTLPGGFGIGYVQYLPMTQSRQLIGSIQAIDMESGQDDEFLIGFLGLYQKTPVSAATVGPGVLALDFIAGNIIDGVVLTPGMRILIKNQINPVENGVGVVQIIGAPVRPSDADTPAELTYATVPVNSGTLNAGRSFTQVTVNPVLGVSPVIFVPYPAAGSLVASHVVSSIPTFTQLLSGIDFGFLNSIALTWQKTDGAVEAGSACWTRFGSIIVKPILHDRFGTVVSNPPTEFTTWREMVGDLLGTSTRLALIDGPTAYLDDAFEGPPPTPITHRTYPDGVTADEILADLLLTEPAYTWAVWGRLPNEKYLFEWRPRPGVIAYEADLAFEALDCPGSTAELWNSVAVRWRDQTGNILSARYASDVPLLTAAGLVREEVIDLGDNVDASGSTVEVTALGFLSDHARPIRSGTLTVTRPLFHEGLEEFVDPWQLVPPFWIRVTGATSALLPLSDEPDGATVFEVVGVTYSTSTASAVLDLDQPRPRWRRPEMGRRR